MDIAHTDQTPGSNLPKLKNPLLLNSWARLWCKNRGGQPFFKSTEEKESSLWVAHCYQACMDHLDSYANRWALLYTFMYCVATKPFKQSGPECALPDFIKWFGGIVFLHRIHIQTSELHTYNLIKWMSCWKKKVFHSSLIRFIYAQRPIYCAARIILAFDIHLWVYIMDIYKLAHIRPKNVMIINISSAWVDDILAGRIA